VAGRFISLEGGEGVGKSTQLKRLAEALRSRGLDVVETPRARWKSGAEAIRSLLLQGDEDRWTAGAEALLFAAARADHVAKTIKPALAEGKWVLSDRFLDSSIAYQGGGSGSRPGGLRQLHENGSGGLPSDRTSPLELAGAAASERALGTDWRRGDRIGLPRKRISQRGSHFLPHARDIGAERFRIVDASGSPRK
jgi:dTMP kinase